MVSKFNQMLALVMSRVKRHYSYYPKHENITSVLTKLQWCQVLTSQSKSQSVAILCGGEGSDKPCTPF